MAKDRLIETLWPVLAVHNGVSCAASYTKAASRKIEAQAMQTQKSTQGVTYVYIYIHISKKLDTGVDIDIDTDINIRYRHRYRYGYRNIQTYTYTYTCTYTYSIYVPPRLPMYLDEGPHGEGDILYLVKVLSILLLPLEHMSLGF